MWHAATARDAATATVDGLDYANAILDWLPDRHAWILGAYYVDGLTQEEIGSRIGLTGSAVAHAMKRSLNTLRQHLAEGTWQR